MIAALWTNEPEFRKRVMTGFAGVSMILLLAYLAGRTGLALLAIAVSLGCMNEFAEIVFKLNDKPEKKLVMMGTTWLVAFVNYWIPRNEFELLIFAFLGVFTYYLVTASRHQGDAFVAHFKEFIFACFGLLYLAFIPLYLPLLYSAASGSHWGVLFLFIVWATDTGGYFAGKKYGARKLYPAISPKKTWEGAYGGLALSILIALIYKVIAFRNMPWGAVVIVPLLVSPASQVGDLCESFLKRAFDVKDSGQILPGHGGFLDRFDGILFSLPVMYGCFKVFAA